MASSSVEALIERYQDDIVALKETGDADDKIIAGVLSDVIADLVRI